MRALTLALDGFAYHPIMVRDHNTRDKPSGSRSHVLGLHLHLCAWAYIYSHGTRLSILCMQFDLAVVRTAKLSLRRSNHTAISEPTHWQFPAPCWASGKWFAAVASSRGLSCAFPSFFCSIWIQWPFLLCNFLVPRDQDLPA